MTNHSNTAVTTNLSYMPEPVYAAIGGSFDNDVLELLTAVGTPEDEAPEAEAYLTLAGDLSSGVTNTKIGSVTVTLDTLG